MYDKNSTSLEPHLPDAEEAQDVVDAVGVEVLGHVRQAAPPPQVAVFRHLLPGGGRDANQ